MNTHLTDPIHRLRAISRDADTLIDIAPQNDVSAVRRILGSLSQLSNALSRVIVASPHSISSVQAARFCTSAETALNGARHLISLYGETPKKNEVEEDAEANLNKVTQGLGAFAKKARQDSVNALIADMNSTLEVIPAWDQPEQDTVDTHVYHGGEGVLAASFISGLSQHEHRVGLPAPSSRPSFIQRVFNRKNTNSPTSVLTDAHINDAEVNGLMTSAFTPRVWSTNGAIENLDISKRLKIKSFGSSIYRLHHDDLEAAGLRMYLHQYVNSYGLQHSFAGVSVTLSPAAPKVRTQLWNTLATDLVDDADSYYRALKFKDDPDFRKSLKESVVMALTQMESQIEKGKIPYAKIESPVVMAAFRMSLVEMGAARTNLRKYFDPEPVDLFGMKDAICQIPKDHPGIRLEAGYNGITVSPVESIEAPSGIAKKVHENKNRDRDGHDPLRTFGYE